jgi:hypothetical protein
LTDPPSLTPVISKNAAIASSALDIVAVFE